MSPSHSRHLALIPWEPFFDTYAHKITSITQWIRISGLLVELWDDTIFRHIMKLLGQFGQIFTLGINLRVNMLEFASKLIFPSIFVVVSKFSPLKKIVFVNSI